MHLELASLLVKHFQNVLLSTDFLFKVCSQNEAEEFTKQLPKFSHYMRFFILLKRIWISVGYEYSLIICFNYKVNVGVPVVKLKCIKQITQCCASQVVDTFKTEFLSFPVECKGTLEVTDFENNYNSVYFVISHKRKLSWTRVCPCIWKLSCFNKCMLIWIEFIKRH